MQVYIFQEELKEVLDDCMTKNSKSSEFPQKSLSETDPFPVSSDVGAADYSTFVHPRVLCAYSTLSIPSFQTFNSRLIR